MGQGPLSVPAHLVLVFIVDFGEAEISEAVLRREVRELIMSHSL